MKYIKYKLVTGNFICFYHVNIEPGNLSGSGLTYKQALHDALRSEMNSFRSV